MVAPLHAAALIHIKADSGALAYAGLTSFVHMNQTTTDSVDLTRFDVRTIPCRVKHGMIFQRWAELPVGAHFVLINDHDPIPLYYQFAAQFPNAFSWEYLPCGPDEFQVKITRLLETAATRPIAPPPRPTAAASHGGCGQTLDCRRLEPPEPMIRILTAVESLPVGKTLHAVTDRRPVHLYAELDTRGVTYSSVESPDGSWVTALNRT